MNKKITITDVNLSLRTSTAIIVQVGLIKFVKDKQYPWVDIFLTGGETDEFVVQADTEKASKVIDLEDLKIFAINWVFENVEVVKEIKKEVAPEVPVQEQHVGICEHCNKTSEVTLPRGLEPKFCMNCGETIQYTKKESPLQE